MKTRYESGQTMVAAVVGLACLAVLVPAMVLYTQREAAWTGKQSKNTAAFDLAEAGQEKAYYTLSITTSNWATIQNARQLTNYNFDKAYTDMAGGEYAIWIGSGPYPQQATVISVGRDAQKQETRAIQATYSMNTVQSAIYGNGLTLTGSAVAEWGPVMSRANMTLSGSANIYYPQKWAVGTITGSGGTHGTWSATSSPCTDNIEWWAYNCKPGIPNPPTFDFSTYKQMAKSETGCPAGGTPSGSCYYATSQTFTGVNFGVSTHTMYCNVDCSFSGQTFIHGTLINLGNLSFTGSGAGAYTVSPGNGIPLTAYKQYAKLIQMSGSVAPGQYFDDAGYPALNPTFAFGLSGNPSMQIGTKMSPTARGFVYCGGTFSASGGSSVHGVVFSPNGISGGAGGFTVFYDDQVSSNILLVKANPVRVNWQGSLTAWPNNLP